MSNYYQPRSRGRILVAEDNNIVRDCLFLTLKAAGFEAITTANGSEALELVEESEQPFDGLITDHDMPRLNGLELVRHLKRRANAIPIMVLSASLDQRTRDQYHETGVWMIVEKPCPGPDIITAVGNLIGGMRAPADATSRHALEVPGLTVPGKVFGLASWHAVSSSNPPGAARAAS